MKGIIDTTLREGEQTPHIYFNLTEKLRIIALLIEAGVDEIELGFAVQNPEIKELIQKAGNLAGCAKFALWCRCLPKDIEETLALSPDVLAISVPVSDMHIEHKLKRNRAYVKKMVREGLRQARDKTACYLSLGLEDASRADIDFVEEISSLAITEGVNRIRFADTVGVMDPVSMFRIVTRLKEQFSVDIGVHTHNDFGMATANALTALEAGADFADVTINGLGERAGIAALEEVAAFLVKRGGISRYRLKYIAKLARYVARVTQNALSSRRPVVGEDIFTCETGIHIDGLIKNPSNYEPFDPEEVSLKRKILIGKKAGKNALRYKLNSLGLKLKENVLPELLGRLKQESSRSKTDFTDDELLSLCNCVLSDECF